MVGLGGATVLRIAKAKSTHVHTHEHGWIWLLLYVMLYSFVNFHPCVYYPSRSFRFYKSPPPNFKDTMYRQTSLHQHHWFHCLCCYKQVVVVASTLCAYTSETMYVRMYVCTLLIRTIVCHGEAKHCKM